MTSGHVRFRLARDVDADRIAALHALSWRTSYRGSYGDHYLDGPVDAERRDFWRARMRHPEPGRMVILAEAAEGLVGFVCALWDSDPRWGTLIDNLHVAPDAKRRGLGLGLMRDVAQHLLEDRPARPIHLTVLEANRAAQAFYDRIGGEPVERRSDTMPDGTVLPVIRYAWASPGRLIEGVGQR